MWLKLKSTSKSVIEINKAIAIAYLTIKAYNEKKHEFDQLSKATIKKRFQRLYSNLHKTQAMSDQVMIHEINR